MAIIPENIIYNMKKIVFIICMVLCNTLLAFAQNNQEIVYLKNGDKVKGIIIEEIPNTSIKVKTSNGSILVYSIHEIEKIISPEDEIFQKNTYMQKIYPENTRDILEVFCLYEATGEYFDITAPSSIIKETFTIGSIEKETGYFINDTCIRCLKCLDVCPQKCVHVDQKVKIDQRHCLSCGRCLEICPVRAIEREI